MIDVLKSLIKQFMPFAQERIGFEYPPKLFLKQDQENAQNPLGKTAYYDPQDQAVTLYVTGRHPKDVLRSLGHELVHHKQNCDGKFNDVSGGDMGEGYAQTNPHLRAMEFEANSKGSMCLRDFEDRLKMENTTYYEHLQKGEKQMSTKDWKNNELTQLLSEAWGFKFNTLQEFDEFNGAGEIQEEAEVSEDNRDVRPGDKMSHREAAEICEEEGYPSERCIDLYMKHGKSTPTKTRGLSQQSSAQGPLPTREAVEEPADAKVQEEGHEEVVEEASAETIEEEEIEEAGVAGRKDPRNRRSDDPRMRQEEGKVYTQKQVHEAFRRVLETLQSKKGTTTNG